MDARIIFSRFLIQANYRFGMIDELPLSSSRPTMDTPTDSPTQVVREPFGRLPDGRMAFIYQMKNRHGLRARLSDLGAMLLSMETPDRNGIFADLTLGYDAFDDWLDNPHYFGASIGRYGNRIANGRFTLDGKTHQLATNNAPGDIPCHLHGGHIGFEKHLWDAAILPDGVRFSRCSPDQEEGYPGNLHVRITYRLTQDNELIWQAEALTESATPVNIIHHSYWNLSGDPTQRIDDHEMLIEADHFLPTTAGLIPTGEKRSVAGTPMDFRIPMPIGARIHEDFEPLLIGNGYDHAWVLREDDGLRRAARIHHRGSGRIMEMITNQPAIQLYTANFIEGIVGKKGIIYANRSAFCLETEAFPDAPNQPAFPNAILRAGETYRHTLIHRFSTD